MTWILFANIITKTKSILFVWIELNLVVWCIGRTMLTYASRCIIRSTYHTYHTYHVCRWWSIFWEHPQNGVDKKKCATFRAGVEVIDDREMGGTWLHWSISQSWLMLAFCVSILLHIYAFHKYRLCEPLVRLEGGLGAKPHNPPLAIQGSTQPTIFLSDKHSTFFRTNTVTKSGGPSRAVKLVRVPRPTYTQHTIICPVLSLNTEPIRNIVSFGGTRSSKHSSYWFSCRGVSFSSSLGGWWRMNPGRILHHQNGTY